MYKTKHYDQIAFKVREGELQLGSSAPSAGSLDYYQSVFPQSEWEIYYNSFEPSRRTKWDTNAGGQEKYFWQEWRTFQMSDHLPLWVELKIDYSDRYLKQLMET
jgi:hypothetical protein